MRSPDARYTVTKYGIPGDDWRYELWRGKEHIATGLPTAEAALELWRTHGGQTQASLQL